ncbi:odorant receptor 67d-like [Aedes albopictus]|uniref:Odorant receptor n=1 Tax=Aedes albopictus TaxID=7160 RepID=A0ABM1Y3K9_AEDAL
MTRGSAEELEKSFEVAKKTTYLVGLNPFIGDRTVTGRFVFSALLMLGIYFLCFYTLWVVGSEWQTSLEVIQILMLNVLGTNKLWLGFMRSYDYYLLFVSSADIYKIFDADIRNRPILRQMVRILAVTLKSMALIYTLSGSLILVLMTAVILITKERLLLLRIYIPFVDHTTPVGYAITTALHMLMIAYCVNGYLASDSVFVSTIFPIVGYTNALRNEIDNFNATLHEVEQNEDEIAEQLMHIVKLHQRIVQYEGQAVAFFKETNLIQINLQAGLLLALVFMGLILHYLPAMCTTLAILFELTLYCSLGTIITTKNNKMILDIYDIDWHLLPKSKQMLVLFMLHRAQNGRSLCVGNFAPMDMQTYVKILKTVYTFLAMLITVMD